MKILITGSSGFIGAATAEFFLSQGYQIVGIDCLNEYYNPLLKKARLNSLLKKHNYKHFYIDITNRTELINCFNNSQPSIVIHLAAQAGVRYSITNPQAYIDSNITGFLNILESCKDHSIKHLYYASSSSVYGNNTELPFSSNHRTDSPINIYGVTKKTNELMAHAYGHLYNLKTTGLRFFTVYGPWGRPDMALLKFADKILNNMPIELYNYGRHKRDFTFIDDVVFCIYKLVTSCNISNNSCNRLNRLFNIGNGKPESLDYFIKCIEASLGRKANTILLPPSPGDMLDTECDAEDIYNEINFKPNTPLIDGVNKTIKWYQNYKF